MMYRGQHAGLANPMHVYGMRCTYGMVYAWYFQQKIRHAEIHVRCMYTILGSGRSSQQGSPLLSA